MLPAARSSRGLSFGMPTDDADTPPGNDNTSLRIVVADDNALLREGIAALLTDAGHQVVGRAVDADDLMLKVRSYNPTSPSSTFACHPATPTTASSPRSRSGARIPR